MNGFWRRLASALPFLFPPAAANATAQAARRQMTSLEQASGKL